jgi:hypothetical protein
MPPRNGEGATETEVDEATHPFRDLEGHGGPFEPAMIYDI